jgi:hypothetical protein
MTGAAAAPSIAGYVPLRWLTMIALVSLAAMTLGAFWLSQRPITKAARMAGTWDCGYARPTARMQYTGSSFSQMTVELLSWLLWPRVKSPRINDVFAARAGFESEVPDVVLDRSLLPGARSAGRLLGWARVIQRGPIQVYLLYVLAILLLLLVFA